jgi:hypothetical protein
MKAGLTPQFTKHSELKFRTLLTEGTPEVELALT